MLYRRVWTAIVNEELQGATILNGAADPFAVSGLIYFTNSGRVILLTLAFDHLISTAI